MATTNLADFVKENPEVELTGKTITDKNNYPLEIKSLTYKDKGVIELELLRPMEDGQRTRIWIYQNSFQNYTII